MKMRKEVGIIFLVLLGIFLIPGVLAADDSNVCCAQTNSGLTCQNVPQSECAPGSQQAPTSCESTSFCQPGVCYNQNEGTCLENTPREVCNANEGTWSETSPPQCSLGCCVLGDQAAFVSLVRCKRLSGHLGLETNFNSGIGSEAACIASVQNQERGACVYEQEFERACQFTTRANCDAGIDGAGRGEFHKDRLCTDPELNTICGPSTETTCLPGKEGVYFLDTCGNPGNIYDSSKVNDDAYWKNVVPIEESCSLGNPAACGNCNYLEGSVCRPSESGNRANHGSNICTNLNCGVIDGQERRHGESWCVNSDAGETEVGKNSVGSRFYRHICLNGEEVVEACADFRQEECIEDSITASDGTEFSQAACRVNRWQDCTAQTEQIDCENTDRRDCSWIHEQCVPSNTPGLRFWEGQEAQDICSAANQECIVTFEKGLFGGESCKGNCHCLGQEWLDERVDVCNALGDCGPNVNWHNQPGNKDGYLLDRV